MLRVQLYGLTDKRLQRNLIDSITITKVDGAHQRCSCSEREHLHARLNHIQMSNRAMTGSVDPARTRRIKESLRYRTAANLT